MTLFGPDVSKWQEGLVPPEPHGIGFGIARATNGFSLDSTVDNVIAWCKQRKVPFCAYHFVYECASHPAVEQAAAFSKAVGADKSIPCMIDWEKDTDDNCHPGRSQTPKWDDVLKVSAEIRKLGHKVTLLYANYYYWKDVCGSPALTGQGLDLVNANYGPRPQPTGSASQIYNKLGGDTGVGWNGYGGLIPVFWQFSQQTTWGNKNLDMNAYRGDPAVLYKWFTTWGTSVTLYPYAYNGSMITMEQLEAKTTVKNLHPEFWRRFKALMEYAATQNVPIGIGTGWRVQPNPPPPGFAAPGNSNHEGFPADGKSGGAVAIDAVVGASFPWMEKNLKAFGLRSFLQPSTTGYKGSNEPWHVQPAEIPASRAYRKTPWRLDRFPLHTDTKPEPTPEPTPVPELEETDMLFICKVGTVIYVGDGVRATAVSSNDVDTIKANVEGVGTSRWRHPARKDLPILTKMADIPTINAGQRDCLVGKLDS